VLASVSCHIAEVEVGHDGEDEEEEEGPLEGNGEQTAPRTLGHLPLRHQQINHTVVHGE